MLVLEAWIHTFDESLVEKARCGSVDCHFVVKVKQECSARVSRKSVKQECPVNSVKRKCRARVSSKSVQEERPARVSRKSDQHK